MINKYFTIDAFLGKQQASPNALKSLLFKKIYTISNPVEAYAKLTPYTCLY